MSQSGYTRFDLPGLNRPLDFTRKEVAFSSTPPRRKAHFPSLLKPDSADAATLPLLTLRELKMLHIMDALTDKQDWDKKVFDDVISETWKVEMMALEGVTVTQKMADFIIAELRFRAGRETENFVVYNGDVVKSDTAVPLSVKEALQEAARVLENIPENLKDYHPGSKNQVLDLVHPSLFPLVYGRTRVLEDRLVGLDDAVNNCGNGLTLPPRTEEEGRYGFSYSRVFQWLPCEVDVSGDSGAKITSYINNLHPQQNVSLYEVIEKIIDCTIPLWDLTLLLNNKYDPPKHFSRIAFSLEYREIPEELVPSQGEYEDEDEYYERRQDFICKEGLIHPEPEEFDPKAFTKYRSEKPLNLKNNFGGRGLQVIVKLANIELTPENPSYDGGSWHVEGQNNEHICATALYYYDSSNITESRLGFRHMSDPESVEEVDYEQEQHGWLQDVFGCQNNEAAIQDVGSVLCREGRLITFPNILQHRVQSFKLQDPTKPGHRKILALFLVDPTIQIISTANVPSQQKDWWAEQVDKDAISSGKGLGKLSAELREQVYQQVKDFPIDMVEAKELRLELMEERRIYIHEHDDQLDGNGMRKLKNTPTSRWTQTVAAKFSDSAKTTPSLMPSLYSQVPFADPGKQIRLLQLDSESLQLDSEASSPETPRYTLAVHEFHGDVRPSYVALSYTWRDAVPLLPLIVNGHSVLVRLNCWYALLQLRHHGYPDLIWVDSLCINQDKNDNFEKNRQVTMMGQIFAFADWVASSLGSNDILTPFFGESDDYISDIKGRLDWTPYFDRVWIKQEIILAREITLFHGLERRAWQDFADKIGTSKTDSSLQTNAHQLARHRAERSRGSKTSLVDLIIRYRKSISTDPRDKIYALLSLLSVLSGDDTPIPVIYGQPLFQLFYNLAKFLFSTSENKHESRKYKALAIVQKWYNIDHNEENAKIFLQTMHEPTVNWEERETGKCGVKFSVVGAYELVEYEKWRIYRDNPLLDRPDLNIGILTPALSEFEGDKHIKTLFEEYLEENPTEIGNIDVLIELRSQDEEPSSSLPSDMMRIVHMRGPRNARLESMRVHNDVQPGDLILQVSLDAQRSAYAVFRQLDGTPNYRFHSWAFTLRWLMISFQFTGSCYLSSDDYRSDNTNFRNFKVSLHFHDGLSVMLHKEPSRPALQMKLANVAEVTIPMILMSQLEEDVLEFLTLSTAGNQK